METTCLLLFAAVQFFLPIAHVSGTPQVEQPSVGTGVGQYYPDFRLPTLDGEITSLSSFRGKKVLLIQFASW